MPNLIKIFWKVSTSRSLLHYWGFAMDYMTFLFIQPKTTMQHNDKQRERKIPCEISQLAINSASKKLLYKILPALIELFLFYWKKYIICSLFEIPDFWSSLQWNACSVFKFIRILHWYEKNELQIQMIYLEKVQFRVHIE